MNTEQHDKIVMAVTMNTMCFMLMAYGYGFLCSVGTAQLSSQTKNQVTQMHSWYCVWSFAPACSLSCSLNRGHFICAKHWINDNNWLTFLYFYFFHFLCFLLRARASNVVVYILTPILCFCVSRIVRFCFDSLTTTYFRILHVNWHIIAH